MQGIFGSSVFSRRSNNVKFPNFDIGTWHADSPAIPWTSCYVMHLPGDIVVDTMRMMRVAFYHSNRQKVMHGLKCQTLCHFFFKFHE